MKYRDEALEQRGRERVKKGGSTKTSSASASASVGISFHKVVFPVTVLSIVVNISSQSKHIEGRGEERLNPSPTYCTSSLIVNMQRRHDAPPP